jgi:hypothetical protein
MQLPTPSIYILLTITKSTVIKSSEDCSLLQSDINFIQGWCTTTYIKLNIGETKFKDLEVFIQTEFHFHNHVNHILYHCIKMLGLVPSIYLHLIS